MAETNTDAQVTEREIVELTEGFMSLCLPAGHRGENLADMTYTIDPDEGQVVFKDGQGEVYATRRGETLADVSLDTQALQGAGYTMSAN